MDHEDDDPGTTWNARARAKPDLMTPAPGVAGDPARLARQRDHLLRHRQQLRDRQRLSDVRTGAQISGARPVRPLRLRLSGDRRRQDRPPRRARRRLRRRRRLRHLHERDDGDRPRRLAGDNDGDLPQPAVGRREAQHDAVVRRQFRRHRTRPEGELRQDRPGLRLHRPPRRRDAGAGGGAARGGRSAGQGRDDLPRGHAQSGARRAFPPRRDEEAAVVVAGVQREDMRPQ